MRYAQYALAGALTLSALAAPGAAQVAEVRQGDGSRWATAQRSTLAVRYIEDKKTSVDMVGTALNPEASGKAEVEFKNGRAEIKLELSGLAHPQARGAYYTTYLLWAIAPEGQASNIAELPTLGGRMRLEATTPFQNFGLIITAEPHAAVKLPSPVVVAENALRGNTKGSAQTGRIEYRGDPGTFYTVTQPGAPALNADYTTPLLILGARRAVEIARRAGAGRYADTELREAEVKLGALEEVWPRPYRAGDLEKNQERHGGIARDAIRLAEQARTLAVERDEQARLEAERRAAEGRVERARTEADVARGEAERVAAAKRQADLDAERARRETAQAQTEAQRAQATAAQAEASAEQARREKEALQQRLYVSLSEILETRREARGLIVNLSDVLFDTGKATLKPGAREKLSKLAGIMLAYPGAYRLEVEGHTDAVGSDESNFKLSEARANSVRDYMLESGIKPDRIVAARGFGETRPVASNDTAAGRQVNRRVEIIIADAETQSQLR